MIGLAAPQDQIVERLKHGNGRVVVSSTIVLLGAFAFACCVAAGFKRVKAEDMVVDGSLCSLPRSSAFGLGIAAIVCLSIAQIVGTSASASASAAAGTSLWLCSGRNKIGSIALLIISWISFGLAAILLGTGSSMNGGQPYGKGWLDGECYVVNKGVYAGAAVLNVATVVFILGFILSTRVQPTKHRHTGPGDGVMKAGGLPLPLPLPDVEETAVDHGLGLGRTQTISVRR